MRVKSNGTLPSAPKPAAPPPPADVAAGTQVGFRTAEGVDLRGLPVRVTRPAIVFELLNPAATLRVSEVLGDFKVVLQGRTLYAGRAVVANLIEAGPKTVCEATLDAALWQIDADPASLTAAKFAKEFKSFITDWEKFYTIAPEFKIVTADLEAFLIELRGWLDKVELSTRELTEAQRTQLLNDTMQEAGPSVVRAIDTFVERFEGFVSGLGKQDHPKYQAHLRRHLHPLLLVSPFARRAYTKPLGYAGDYGMVNMMLHPVAEGESLYAKMVNLWLLGQAPAQAHRNRVMLLERILLEECVRVRSAGRNTTILNLGCGPAVEVQRFMEARPVPAGTEFTLLDFNEETLDYVKRIFANLRQSHQNYAKLNFVKKSVLQILRDNGRSLVRPNGRGYDYIYCAGLFDYLQKDVCKQILTIFYRLLAPGGLLLATNATEKLNSSRPFRFSMEYFLDWHLIYRDRDQFQEVAPDEAPADSVVVSMEQTGVNLFLKIRKPDDASDG